MSVSIAGLEAEAGCPWTATGGGVDARRAIGWVGTLGVRAIQLDATLATIRPRELDRSARRDLAALLRRGGLALSGLDLFIAPEQFKLAATVERAIQAAIAAAELIAELAGLMDAQRVVSVTLPRGNDLEIVAKLDQAGQVHGVVFADHAMPLRHDAAHVGVGIDPAALLMAGEDPVKVVLGLGHVAASARLCDAGAVGRVGVGQGRLNVLEYSAALHAAGYRSPLVVDVRGVREQEQAAGAALTR